MTQIKIYIPSQQPELEQTIQALVQDIYDQTGSFETIQSSTKLHKDGSYAELALQVITIVASIEGTLQFTKRVKLMEGVKKLIALCKRDQVNVFIEVEGENPFEITQHSVDDTVDRLSRPKK